MEYKYGSSQLNLQCSVVHRTNNCTTYVCTCTATKWAQQILKKAPYCGASTPMLASVCVEWSTGRMKFTASSFRLHPLISDLVVR